MKEIKKSIYVILGLLSFLGGCKTLPVNKEASDLCGYVIDENNKPVEDFIIHLKNEKSFNKCGITDATGMFLVSDVPMGKLKVSGYKNGYATYENQDFVFYNPSKIFCLQVNSADAILNKVEKHLRNEAFDKAEKELAEIYCYKNQILERVIEEYRKVIKEKINENESI